MPAHKRQFCKHGHDTHESGRVSNGECRVCHNNRIRLKNRVRNGIKGATSEKRTGDCEICGTFVETLCQDHVHATGETRGWLCKACNMMLGYAKDCPLALRRAAEYLEREMAKTR